MLSDCHSKQYTRFGGCSITDGERQNPRELILSQPGREKMEILLGNTVVSIAIYRF